jgi:hypothetical protein
MVEGSCLCGSVRFRASGALTPLSHCHCSMCRKTHGAAFATFTQSAPVDFEWLSGVDALVRYESSPGFERAFCGSCGSMMPGPETPDVVYIPAGCLDDDPGVRPDHHIFAASGASWYTITDGLPAHAAYQPSSDTAVVERAPPPAPSQGVARGSCLCGDVAFEVTEPFKVSHNCHCSRCRKARAAAHTTNAFTSSDGVTFVRGADQIQLFKPEGAKFFAHTFCSNCGSGVPRIDTDRGIALVPLGAMDDDPGITAVDNIYVGSKAPWYTITDALPQFEEGPS